MPSPPMRVGTRPGFTFTPSQGHQFFIAICPSNGSAAQPWPKGGGCSGVLASLADSPQDSDPRKPSLCYAHN